jgi:hypothetical protein
MNRKVILGALLAAALTLAGGKFLAGRPDPKDHHAGEFGKCAKACGDCQRACDACAAHCANLLAKGNKDHLRTLSTCQDCATHCSAAACVISRQGPFADLICTACAEACARCGKECEKFKDDEHMRKCAEECFRCEKACREMLKHVGHHDKGKEGK